MKKGKARPSAKHARQQAFRKNPPFFVTADFFSFSLSLKFTTLRGARASFVPTPTSHFSLIALVRFVVPLRQELQALL